MDGPQPMTSLTWVSGVFRARVVAARLASEGIDAQLRGALDSSYGLTVGDMARIDVFVPEDQLEDARYVLLVDEVDATLGPPSEWWDAGSDSPRTHRWPWWVALVVLAVAVIGPFLSYAGNW